MNGRQRTAPDTYLSLWREGEALLERANVSEARLDAWLLLEYTAKISRAWYFAHQEEPVQEQIAARYRELIGKRAERVPIQHLTHQAFFMGHEFYVDDRVLIPRQDTECLVEKALSLLAGYQNKRENKQEAQKKALRILDLCTGSGCILLSILAKVPQAFGVGTDLSEDALCVAEQNARRLSLEERVTFVQSDLFSGEFFQEKTGFSDRTYDMLISNPPYIPTAQIETLMDEVRFHDPRMALDGKEDGLYFYREIIRRASGFLVPGGYLLFEIGFDQGAFVSGLLREAGFLEVSVLQDLAGQDRVVTGRCMAHV